MIPPASRRDKALAFGPVLVAHGLAAWLLVAGSSDAIAPSGVPDPVISIELFDARTTAPEPAPAAAAISATANPDARPQTVPIRPASPSNAVDRLLPLLEPKAISAAAQPQPSTTLSSISSPSTGTSARVTVANRDGPSTTVFARARLTEQAAAVVVAALIDDFGRRVIVTRQQTQPVVDG